MTYLTHEEYLAYGYPDTTEFSQLNIIAERAIDLVVGGFYSAHDFELDVALRKNLVKLAVASQVDYLNRSGILTAEDKQQVTSMKIGRTAIDMASAHSTRNSYNLSRDTVNYLNRAGFGYAGVSYDR